MPKLTTLAARQIAEGETLRDEVVRGLTLEGKRTGAMWLYRYRFAGQRRAPKLGEYPTLSIEAARDAARAMAALVAQGRDPSAERKATRDAPTMDELFKLYVAARTDKTSLEQDERNWLLHVSPRVGTVKASAFGLAEANAVLEATAKPRWRDVPLRTPKPDGTKTRRLKLGGPIAANRVRALLSGVLAFAERSDVAARPRGSNFVMTETKLNPENKRQRHMRRDEFPRIWQSLEHYAATYPRHGAALWASLYTGTRVSELLGARREWRDGNVLRLPEHKTMRHTGTHRVIILPRQARDLLDAAPDDGSGYLFGKLDRFRVSDVWNLVRTRAECPDIQPRDIRRTFASVGRTTGLDLDRVADLLGHAGDVAVTAGYAYIFDEDKTAMVQGVADAMDRMAEGAK